jgi:hypothetical protein
MLKPVNITDLNDVTMIVGTLPYARQFTYLGSKLVPSLGSDEDVDRRISMASKLFGALKSCVFCNKLISNKLKGSIYLALVLSVLLYGCENWILSSSLIQKISVFHNRCIRTMTGVTKWTQAAHRLTSASLLKRVRLPDMITLLTGRQAGWMGHVARLSEERLPRKFLSCFLSKRRTNHLPHSHGHYFLSTVLKRALNHPDMLTFPLNIDLMEIKNHLEGSDISNVNYSLVRDSIMTGDDEPKKAWIHLAMDKVAWANIRALMNHSLRGEERYVEVLRCNLIEGKKDLKMTNRLKLESNYWPEYDDGGGDPNA